MAAITNAMIDEKLLVFTTDRNKLRDLGQEIAMMILNHAAPEDAGPNAQGTGDCTRAVKLASEMPKSWAAQLTTWFTEMSPIRIAGTKVAYCDEYKLLKVLPEMSAEEKQAVRDERLKWWKLEEAAIRAFHTFDEPESKTTILDLNGIIKWLQSQANAIEKKADDGKVAPEEIATAKAIAERLRAIKVVHVDADNDVPVAPAPEAPKQAEDDMPDLKVVQAA
jgi:hypothetical protein